MANNRNRILIIAPHGDDELNLLGTVADQFLKANWEIHLLLVTNGDYLPKVTEKRHQETEAVTNKMGISKVIYLGYGDNPGFSGTHTYHTEDSDICPSPAGNTHTYGFEDAPDYAYQNHGFHRPYCRNSVKEDIKECILAEQADTIVCVDLDEHADHRMTSLLFDEIMVELVRTTTYRPLVLKKYAYAGVWFGTDDYYANPMAETRLTDEEYFPYSSHQEVRVRVPRKYYPVFYKKSPIYKLCKLYKSQYVIEHYTRMVNADALYFYRDYNNLALSAQVQVSSGEGRFLNDGKLADFSPINQEKSAMISGYEVYTWLPSSKDLSPSAVFKLDRESTVQEVHLHLPYQEDFRPKKVKVIAGISVIEADLSDLRPVITFDPPAKNVKEVTLQFLDAIPDKCGIREVEIFDHHSTFPWSALPFTPYNPKSLVRYRPGSTLVPKISCKINLIQQFIKYDLRGNGLKYYMKKLLRKFKR